MSFLRRFTYLLGIIIFCGIFGAYLRVVGAVPIGDPIVNPYVDPKADPTLPTGSSTSGAGDGSTDPTAQETGDPNCPKADPISGLAYVCGYIRSSRIEHLREGDPSSPVVTGKPIKGATLAMYGVLPTSSGKNIEIVKWGLGALSASDVTHSDGYFSLIMKMNANPEHLAYPVVLCNGKIGGIGRVDTMYSVSDVFYVNCPSKLSYVTPPDVLQYVSLADRNNVLQCDTTNTEGVALDTKDSSTSFKSIGYVDKPVTQQVDAVLYELQFDIRYANIAGGGIFPPHEGSWWSWDCVRKDGKKCFTEYPIPTLGSNKSPPLILTPGDGENFGTNFVNATGADYRNMVDYVTANILDTLPLRATMPLYRRFELKENAVNMLQFEKAPASYLQTMFGGIAGNISIPARGSTGGALVPCENFKNASKLMGSSEAINSQTAGGPAIGLSSPFQWEKMYAELSPDLLDLPVCSNNGSPVTLRNAGPGTEFFNPVFLLDKGGGALGRTNDSSYDSITSGGVRPGPFFTPAISEADFPDKTASNVVLPEDAGHLSSVVAASTAATKGAYIEGGALTDGLSQPFKEDYSYKKGKVIWDWGANVKALCSSPAYDPAGKVVDNDFKAVLGDQRKNDTTPSTQIFYTTVALLRDRLLWKVDHALGVDYDLVGFAFDKDTVDSYLSTFEASENKLEMDKTNWLGAIQAFFGIAGHAVIGDGDQKSFYQRRNMNAVAVPASLSYPISEELSSFPALFPSGSMLDNPTGTGGLGESPAYPWHDDTNCSVWGQNFSVAACNSDILPGTTQRNCLRTCRLSDTEWTHETRGKEVTYTGCQELWMSVGCSFKDDPAYEGGPRRPRCTCGAPALSYRDCSATQKFQCVSSGANVPLPGGEGSPHDPLDPENMPGGRANCPNNKNKTWDGPTIQWCGVDQAGPFADPVDLGAEGAGVSQPAPAFRTTQEPVNPIGNPMAVGDQTPIEPILSSANLMVQSWASPFSGTKSYEGLGCVDYENTKTSETGFKRMWCKDTPRVGDAGASSALMAIAAGPIFPDASNSRISYAPFGSAERLFAGPVYAAFLPEVDGKACDTPDGNCTFGDPPPPVPPEVTIDAVQGRINPSCGISACSLNVGVGLEDPIPPLLKDILGAAGSDWKVPAKVLLAFMVAEGYFTKDPVTGIWTTYDWTDANILAWSLPLDGNIVKKNLKSPCDDLNWGEQGAPSMFMKDWDDSADLSACKQPFDGRLKCGIERLVPTRGQHAKRCNLLDAAYGLAQSAWMAAGQPTGCKWTSAQVAGALRGFTGTPIAEVSAPGSTYYGTMENVIASCQPPL